MGMMKFKTIVMDVLIEVVELGLRYREIQEAKYKMTTVMWEVHVYKSLHFLSKPQLFTNFKRKKVGSRRSQNKWQPTGYDTQPEHVSVGAGKFQ